MQKNLTTIKEKSVLVNFGGLFAFVNFFTFFGYLPILVLPYFYRRIGISFSHSLELGWLTDDTIMYH